jgi:Ca2+/H+ antiporter, TMEM165/GDT1 family
MDTFWLSLSIVFLAELGDKTQLVALCLASRYKAWVVLSGILVATLVVHVISVLLGGGIGCIMPEAWIKIGAGAAFIGFGLWTLKGDKLEDDDIKGSRHRSPFMIVAVTFFLAELGDKTMLSTVTLATDHSIIPVWLGSSLGMVLSDGIAIVIGQLLGAKLPERAVKMGAAVIFFGFGLFTITQGAISLSWYGWAIAAFIIAVLFVLFIRGNSKKITPNACPKE